MTHPIQHQFGKFLATLLTVVALTVLVLSALPAPVSARTFDVDARGSMILNPDAPEFACAMERAMLNRNLGCRQISSPDRRSSAR